MDIKLHARLAAYSKIESLDSNKLPTPDSSNVGDIISVNINGNYTLIDSVTRDEIDTLFDGSITPAVSVNKDTIDTLFLDDQEVEIVTKAAIDSLFQ